MSGSTLAVQAREAAIRPDTATQDRVYRELTPGLSCGARTPPPSPRGPPAARQLQPTVRWAKVKLQSRPRLLVERITRLNDATDLEIETIRIFNVKTRVVGRRQGPTC